MICKETGVLAALDAGPFSYITNRTFLGLEGERQYMIQETRQTSFQRCLDIRSTPVIGSMKTSFATRVSGIQIAQSR